MSIFSWVEAVFKLFISVECSENQQMDGSTSCFKSCRQAEVDTRANHKYTYATWFIKTQHSCVLPDSGMSIACQYLVSWAEIWFACRETVFLYIHTTESSASWNGVPLFSFIMSLDFIFIFICSWIWTF